MYRATDSERITRQSETEGWSPEGLAKAPIPQPAAPAEPRSEKPAPTRAQPATPAPPDVPNTPAPPTGRAIPMQATGSAARRIAAFANEATDKLRRQAESFARRRSRVIEYSGGRADAVFVEDLVQDVFTDVLIGDLPWDPDQRSLASRVFFTIKARTQQEWKHTCKFQHRSIDAGDDALAGDVENALAGTAPVSNPETARFVTEVVARIRELAADDRHVLALVDAMCAGLVDRADLMSATGITPREYKAARSRLDRILKDL
jgi:hypothetical protein